MTIGAVFVHKHHKNLLQSSPDVYYRARGETLQRTTTLSQQCILVVPFHFKMVIFFYSSA